MEGRDFIKKLSNCFAGSGREDALHPLLREYFQKYSDEIKIGRLGDFCAVKRGRGKLKIMVAAHGDEIGLMVKAIDDRGFIRFTNFGGVDPKTLLAQEVIIYGKKEVYGVIAAKPPHVLSKEEMKSAVKIEDMLIDTGMTREELAEFVSAGDYISIKREAVNLSGDYITGKALDNRVGIAVMYECAKLLENIEHEADVYFVVTTMEELGHFGVRTMTYNIEPDIGIAVDVTFGDKYENLYLPSECGKGVEICLGPNLHPELSEMLIKISEEKAIPYTIDVIPANTGTDAWDIQNIKGGIPTLMLSVPLKFMHTATECVKYNDIEAAAKLLALFIKSFKDWGQVYDA